MCSQLRHKRPRTHQKKRGEGFPSYDESVQGHLRKKEGEERKGKKERKKERGRERERRREKEKKGRCSPLRTSVQGHTKEREGWS